LVGAGDTEPAVHALRARRATTSVAVEVARSVATDAEVGARDVDARGSGLTAGRASGALVDILFTVGSLPARLTDGAALHFVARAHVLTAVALVRAVGTPRSVRAGLACAHVDADSLTRGAAARVATYRVGA